MYVEDSGSLLPEVVNTLPFAARAAVYEAETVTMKITCETKSTSELSSAEQAGTDAKRLDPGCLAAGALHGHLGELGAGGAAGGGSGL